MFTRIIVPIVLIFVVIIASLALSKAIQNRNRKLNNKDIFTLLAAFLVAIIEFKSIRDFFKKSD